MILMSFAIIGMLVVAGGLLATAGVLLGCYVDVRRARRAQPFLQHGLRG